MLVILDTSQMTDAVINGSDFTSVYEFCSPETTEPNDQLT